MKSLFIILLPLLFFRIILGGYGQNNTFPPSGNVGIGTTNPVTKVHIYDASYRMLSMQRGPSYVSHFEMGLPFGQFAIGPFPLSTEENRAMVMDQEGNVAIGYGTRAGNFGGKLVVKGNVGIGTASPSSTLHVNGDIRVVGEIRADGGYSLRSSNGNVAGVIGATGETDASNGIRIYSSRGSGKIVFITHNGGNTEKMRIAGNGNVGIGTASPSHKLEVKGTIRAREVKLEANNWPDYVFSRDYRLPSLDETRVFIEAYGHLPGLRSAGEYEAEGVNMLELNQKLLEKIEELTLYMIDQRSVMDDQGKKIDDLELELRELKEIIKGQL